MNKPAFIFTLDHLPDRQLNPNVLRRLHWSERSAVMRVAREEAGWTAKSQGIPDKPMVQVKVSYEFTVKDRRDHDPENLCAACKPVIDGLIDAGVLMSDSGKYLKIGGVEVIYGDKEQTIITVEEQN